MSVGRLRDKLSNADELTNLLRLLEGTDGLVQDSQVSIQFENKSIYGISRLRDRVFEDGVEQTDPKDSARLSAANGEYKVANGTGGGNTTDFRTAVSGRYMPQRRLVTSGGFRFPVTPVGNQTIEFGYRDNSDGFPFGIGSDGEYLAVDSAGSRVTTIDRTDWNIDKLDGTGPSRLTLDLTRGNIFRTVFEWYGYGDVFWVVKVPDSRGRQKAIPVHCWSPSGGVSIANPNLPIAVKVDNAGVTSNAIDVFVAGRGVGVLGPYDPLRRVTSEEVLGASVANGSWTPIIAARRKDMSAFPPVSAKPGGFTIVKTDADLLVALFVGDTVTPDSTGWRQAPNDGDAGETGLEWLTGDEITSATLGVPIWKDGVMTSGTGATAAGFLGRDVLNQDVPDRDPVVLAAKGTGSVATVSAILRMREEW